MTKMEKKPKTRLEKKSVSFVIRIWREQQISQDGEWRGWIEHAQTRQRHYFREMTEINSIIEHYLSNSGKEENSGV